MKCHEEVPDSDGIAGPCDRPAVGWRIDPEANQPYPVCVTHHRWPYADQWVADRATVQRVEALLRHADEYGDYDEHNEGCEGEPTCPACWVTDIRRALNPDTGGTDE